jgi:hypothetical protein
MTCRLSRTRAGSRFGTPSTKPCWVQRQSCRRRARPPRLRGPRAGEQTNLLAAATSAPPAVGSCGSARAIKNIAATLPSRPPANESLKLTGAFRKWRLRRHIGCTRPQLNSGVRHRPHSSVFRGNAPYPGAACPRPTAGGMRVSPGDTGLGETRHRADLVERCREKPCFGALRRHGVLCSHRRAAARYHGRARPRGNRA